MSEKFISEFPSTCFLEKQVDIGFMYIFFHIPEHKVVAQMKNAVEMIFSSPRLNISTWLAGKSDQESATLAIYCRREGAGGNYLCGQSPTEEQEPTDTTNLEVRTYLHWMFVRLSIRCQRKLVGTSVVSGPLISFACRCEEYSLPLGIEEVLRGAYSGWKVDASYKN